jgi:hypothetical protein
MKEQLRYFIEENKLIDPNDKVLVAVRADVLRMKILLILNFGSSYEV